MLRFVGINITIGDFSMKQNIYFSIFSVSLQILLKEKKIKLSESVSSCVTRISQVFTDQIWKKKWKSSTSHQFVRMTANLLYVQTLIPDIPVIPFVLSHVSNRWSRLHNLWNSNSEYYDNKAPPPPHTSKQGWGGQTEIINGNQQKHNQ